MSDPPPGHAERPASASTPPGLMAELLRSGIGAGSVRLGSIGFALLLSVMLARGLGPVQFGEYAFVTTLIYVLSLPIGHALMQLVTRETALAVHIGDGARLAGLMRWGRQRVGVFTAAVVVLISIVALPRATWDPADRWTLLVFAAPALPFIGAIALRAGVLAGLKRVVAAQIAELTLVSVALVAGMLNGSVAAIAYTLAAIAGFAMVTLLGRQTRQALPGGAALPKTDSRWSHAWLPFVLLSAAGALNAQLGVLMLGWLASSDQVGAMQIAEQGSRDRTAVTGA